ncbi:DUF2489 domain-containing protein [Zooshikella sp. RANM57]|uniref:DUF2489 domain-containing protein n=1 Tax=Zooshikella sp. RANM57 TaxID=3425863 RepID=UPI003D6F8692
MTLYTLLLIIATVITLALAIWAIKLWREVFQNQAKIREYKKQHRDFLISSIRLIAAAVVNEQVNLSEACIRLRFLLENIDENILKQADFAVIDTMYLATKDMPTHDERHSLRPNKLNALDKERLELEAQYRQEIMHAAKKLLVYGF